MANSQNATAQEAGRPQPQTTVEPAGPFVRNSQAGRDPSTTLPVVLSVVPLRSLS